MATATTENATVTTTQRAQRKIGAAWPMLTGGLLTMAVGYVWFLNVVSHQGSVLPVCMVALGLLSSTTGAVLYRVDETRFWERRKGS